MKKNKILINNFIKLLCFFIERFSITQKQLNDALNKCFSNMLLIDLVIPEIEEKLLSAHIPA